MLLNIFPQAVMKLIVYRNVYTVYTHVCLKVRDGTREGKKQLEIQSLMVQYNYMFL